MDSFEKIGKNQGRLTESQCSSAFSDFADLSLLDEGILLGELLLVLALVVEGAFVILGVAVLAAEDVVALAGETEETHLAFALPACAFVDL